MKKISGEESAPDSQPTLDHDSFKTDRASYESNKATSHAFYKIVSKSYGEDVIKTKIKKGKKPIEINLDLNLIPASVLQAHSSSTIAK